LVLDRQYGVEAGKDFMNHVVGEEGHANICQILASPVLWVCIG